MTTDELNKEPNNLSLPTDFAWPKPVAKELALWDKSYLAWAELQSVLFERVEELAIARRLDSEALTEAVKAGKPDPGLVNVAKAERAVVYAEEAARQARVSANRLARTASETIVAHRLDIIEQACLDAEAGATAFAEDIVKARESVSEALTRRDLAYAGLRYVEGLTGGHLSYVPNFAVEGNTSFPQTHENRPLGIVALLRKLVLSVEPVTV